MTYDHMETLERMAAELEIDAENVGSPAGIEWAREVRLAVDAARVLFDQYESDD